MKKKVLFARKGLFKFLSKYVILFSGDLMGSRLLLFSLK